MERVQKVYCSLEDITMPKFSFPKLFKESTDVFESLVTEMNTVWLDAERMFEDFEKSFPAGARHSNFPPRNLVKTDVGYVISFAVAGFKRDELTVEVDSNKVLTVAGKIERAMEASQYLFKGIATRQFENKLQLLDGDEVVGVKLEDGILSVNVKRTTPAEPTSTKLTIE
jgi:molecular chaperone IbpA